MAARLGRALTPVAARRSIAEPVVLAAAIVVVVVTVVLPLVAVAARVDVSSLAVLSRVRPWVSFGRSLVFAAAITLSALVIGVPCGAVFARARIPLAPAWFALHLVPVFLPPFFSALGWFHVFGVRGIVGGPRSASLFFGPIGAWAVLTLTLAPILTGLTALGIRALDPALEESARLVARPWRVVARILVPAAAPQIALGALVVFALAFAELGVPTFLRVDVYPAAIFARLGGMDFAPGEAAVSSLPVLGVAALLTLAERRVLGPRGAGALALRVPSRERLDFGVAAPVLAFGAALVSMTPLAILGAHAAPAFGEVGRWIGASVQNGLVVALATAVLATMVGFALGHALAHHRRVARWADAALLFAFFAPSAVLGVGIVTVWNRPATQLVYGSAAILVVGLGARYGVLGVRAIAAAVAQTSASYEEAAAVAGAGYLRRLARVVVPMQHRGVIAAFGLTSIFCLRDLETTVLFYPPGGETLTVRIFTLEANGPTPVVAALAVLHAAVTVALLLVLAWVYERSRP